MTITRQVHLKYRAYPTEAQEAFLRGAFGATRVVYNDYVYQKDALHKAGSKDAPRDLTKLSSLPEEYEWLKQYGSKILQQAQRDAQKAYQNWFASLAGRRKGPKVGHPRYRRKKAGGSLRWNGASLQVKQLNAKWAAVRLPKDGSWLKFRLTQPLVSPSSVTLKLTPAGEYFVSFVAEQEVSPFKTEGSAAGVDVGLIDLVAVVQSDGTRYKVAAPKHYRRAQRKLARLQKELSRKAAGSARREKARLKVAKQHARVAAARQDHHRKVAYRLASENQAVSMEDLAVRGMVKNRRLAKSISDAGLASLRASVQNACERLGTEFGTVDRWLPSSQACAVCGVRDGKKSLGVREWVCPACGALLDRDWNAALNVLLAAGHAERLNARGGGVRLLLAGAVLWEASTPAGAAASASGSV